MLFLSTRIIQWPVSRDIARSSGVPLKLVRVADRSAGRKRHLLKDPRILTTDLRKVTHDPDIDIVVELIGGLPAARRVVMDALAHGKHVVTANKHLLSEKGGEIVKAAAKRHLLVGFEAAVCGGVPLIKAIREGLIANRVRHVLGILNGTTNFILTRMDEAGIGYREALEEARRLGFAEPDPRMDVEGWDTAHKASTLAWLIFGQTIPSRRFPVEGITGISRDDMEAARRLGCRIKLIAVVSESRGRLWMGVHPALVPAKHPLADVRNEFNAVYLEGDLTGPLLFYGRGAGKRPTVSAVISDLVDIGAHVLRGERTVIGAVPALKIRGLSPRGEFRTEYYLRWRITDRPGMIGKIAAALGREGVNIASTAAMPAGDGAGRVEIVTGLCREAQVGRAVARADRLPGILQKARLLRFERGLVG